MQKNGEVIKSYTYGDASWKDLLTAFNGQSITYDAIGNPLSYRGMTLSWEGGRRLASVSKEGLSASYVYNTDGIRTQKTVNGVTTNYYFDGSSILRQVTGNDVLEFFYDANGVLGFYYNNTPYYYLKNLQGDIVGILDANGTQVVSYTYDAWGAPLSVTGTAADTIGQLNPFRYRSYYYDNETGLYYLNSRYYDPETYRFLNADVMIKAPGTSVLSTNMFAYCENNPVICSDSTGQWFGLDDLIAGAVGAVVGVASQFVSDIITSAISGSWQFSSWQTYVGAGVGGAIGGVTTLYAGPVIGAAVGAGSSTLIGQTLENVTGGQKRSAAEIVKNTVVDATIGAVVSKAVPVKVSGITSGRNSMAAVFKSGLTKLGNKTASKMSMKVVGKGIASSFVADLGLASGMGVKSFISDSWQSYQNRQTATPTVPIYWCAS